MSRVLVVGMGMPGSMAARRHAGPGLRASHLATALSRAGHDVLQIAVLEEDEEVSSQDGLGTSFQEDRGDLGRAGGEHRSDQPGPVSEPGRIEWTTERDLFSTALRRRLLDFAPEAVVGVTVYAAALALRLRLEVPFWADVFGDLMAEAQAKAARTSNDWSIVHFWSLLRPVLEGADRFSAVSRAQSHALLGQLGLAGRLSARTAEEKLVTVIPCSAEATSGGTERSRTRRLLGLSEDDFVLLLSGGVNTWCDVETLGRGVARAMARNPKLHVLVTGGGIPGHDEASHVELAQHLAALPSGRVHDLGWVDSGRLPDLYRAADLALNVERDLVERRLGAENRVVEWLAYGLPCVTTARSECGADLVHAGLALPCRVGDETDLADAIQRASMPWEQSPQRSDHCMLSSTEDRGTSPGVETLAARIGQRGRVWAEQERAFSKTAAVLARWCDRPAFAKDRDGARLVRLGLVSQPGTSAEMLEAYVAALPVREILRRGLRWLARRTGTALASLRRPGTRRVRPGRNAASGPLGLLLLLLAAGLSGGGCTSENSAAPGGPPNVLLVSIDTLRADHLGAYGYAARPSPTPWMDAMASDGLLFENAISSAPETAPALATLLTGVYQDRHGVLYNRRTLAEENHTLAERFQEAGYATAGFVGNWLVDAKHGFAQGFNRYEVVEVGGVGGSADDKLVSLFGEFLRSEDAAGPWFAWVHMMDPHGAYNSAPPWWSRHFDYTGVPPLREGEFPVSESNFGLGVIPRYQKLDGAVTLADYVRRYDGEIRFTDTQVGTLLGQLAARGLAERTLVVLVSDHGESLDEHNEILQHGWFVYDATVRVPLVVTGVAGASQGQRVAELACGVDVAPAILDLAGIAADGHDFDGRPLAYSGTGTSRTSSVTPMSPEGAALREAGCFSIGPRANHPFALRTERYKTVVTPAGAPRDPKAPKGTRSDEAESVELYDLNADPGERNNLAESRPDLTQEMVGSITELRSRFRAHGWRW